MKKVIITGTTGFVGSRLYRFLETDYAVVKADHNALDITDAAATAEFIEKEIPDYVICAAGLSDTQYCQNNEAQSFAVNVTGTANVATACNNVDAKLVFFSSDQIYNGSKHLEMHNEESDVAPISVYGKHKLAAEKAIAKIMDDYVILRSTWLYDFPQRGCKTSKNLFTGILNAYLKDSTVTYSCNDFRGITYVAQIVENFPKIIKLPAGIYNLGSENNLDTYKTACIFAECLGLENAKKHILCDKNHFCDYPKNLMISNDKLRNNGVDLGTTLAGFKQFKNDFSLYIEK